MTLTPDLEKAVQELLSLVKASSQYRVHTYECRQCVKRGNNSTLDPTQPCTCCNRHWVRRVVAVEAELEKAKAVTAEGKAK